MGAKKGDKVKVDYTGTFEDGTVFDTSEGHQPLEIEIGGGQVIKGFEEAITGMDKGAEKEIVLQPKDAYGDLNPDFIKKVPRKQIPIDQELKPDMMLGMSLPNGAQIPAKVKEVTDDNVTLDLNHPLAGKVLHYKLKIVSIA